jgi:hypothetical protein
MYSNPPNPQNADFLTGQQAYRALDTTVRLTQLMRQDGHDEETIPFLRALEELLVYQVFMDSWQLLNSRVQNELTLDEVESFNDALRLYFCREDVRMYNHRRLRDCKQPILKIKSTHTGQGDATTQHLYAVHPTNL